MKREFKIIMEVVVGLTHGLRRSRAVIVVAAAAASVVLAACGGDGDDPEEPLADSPPPTVPGTTEPAEPSEPPPETTEPADEPEETLSPEEQVLEDYLNARAAFAAAYDPPNPDDPDLLATYDGDALAGTQDELEDLVEEGHSWIVVYESSPEVIALAPDSAVVRDCYRDTSQLIETETREELGEPDNIVWNVQTTLVPKDGTWVIFHRQQLEEECTPSS